MKDKYSALWVSHSSMGDYLKCPRLYFLKNVYRDPKTNHKIMLMQPPLALGQAVHDVVEALSMLPVEERLCEPLMNKFEQVWQKVSGNRGGFKDSGEEETYKERGRKIIQRIIDNPGPILEKAVRMGSDLPHFWFSEEDNIILCGKIDWLRYQEADDSVHILDFKTGKHEEDSDSFQLPIYALLVTNCQKRKISGASYWYMDRDDAPTPVDLPDTEKAAKDILNLAKKIQLARKLNHLVCGQNGCRFCTPYEAIARGKGTLVGESEYHQDVYVGVQ